MKSRLIVLSLLATVFAGCQNQNKENLKKDRAGLIILDPGHFHAALMQKSMYPEIDTTVHVYAPDSSDVKSYLNLINGYNSRKEDPTSWKEEVYTGAGYLQKMLDDKKGDVVLISGNNQKKAEYIKRSVEAGFNVLADKPMAVDSNGFAALEKSFASAEKNKVLLYDIMTERYEITNILQKELSHIPAIFGQLEKGTLENPAISIESIHYFYKIVSGNPLVRPQWFFDSSQAGDGLVDITTHLVDLVQWQNFPDATLNYKTDVNMLAAKHWPTILTAEQFKQVTNAGSYPAYLGKNVANGKLSVFSNGEMNYTLKDVHVKLMVRWDFQAPAGGDSHYCLMRGTKASLVIRQGKEQEFKPTLFIEPLAVSGSEKYEGEMQSAFAKLAQIYPGIELKKSAKGWEVIIPESYKVGHEAHFAEVTKRYLKYLQDGKIPEKEVAGMLTKYYTTTQALKKAGITK